MMIDARSIPSEETIETEVCIVGTGPAGVALAREFIGQDFRVCLLESGGIDPPNEDTKSLAEVETEGGFVPVTPDSRNRMFGGNSNYWAIKVDGDQLGLRHRPLDEVDFEQRDWLPYSGWPFKRSHLVPYYERAQEVFQLGPFAYEGSDWEDETRPQIPFGGDRITTRVFQFSPGVAIYRKRRDEINRAHNITTYLKATVVELETDDTGKTVTRVRVACLDGNRFWVAAKIFILAVGGVGSAHLLLLANRIQKNGLGNQHDLVGRFFMDHPLVFGGYFIPSNPQLFNSTALYDMRPINGLTVMGALSLTDEAIRREHLPNISFNLFPRPKKIRRAQAALSLKALIKLRAFQEGPQGALRHLNNVLTGMDDLATSAYDKITRKPFPRWCNFSTGGWSYLQDNRDKVYESFEVLHQTEQFPHPDNRVVLSDQCDKLGIRKPKMQVRWHDEEIQGIKRAQKVMAEEIARTGLGRFEIEDYGGTLITGSPGTSHHLGTTRMSNDPKQGVVDEHCQVHDVSNLFIASSSVFPTGGYANPTLTIAALAIRLADWVKTLMNQSAVVMKESEVNLTLK
ncbi:MAG: GMC family oxidoreductase [Leptolyngbyaceae cyanobacterium RU_5_1]|nr:GMC family oxidoreductase [Leptolyngbyaceae cyanobacterium RU_5_1]